MDYSDKKILMGLDVSTACIGCAIIMDDGSEHGKILELTHVLPKVKSSIKGIEQLFIKKQIFNDEFLSKWKNVKFDEVIIEEPLVRSNNVETCATLLRFNGMISDCIYNVLGVVPKYISSYDARKYAFPELMSIRKYGKDEKIYEKKKILRELNDSKLVLFGGYPWTVDKKSVIQGKVSDNFPTIEWLYNKNGELKKENFDACDAYVAVVGYLNHNKFGDLDFKVENINEKEDSVTYDVKYWGKCVERTTYFA